MGWRAPRVSGHDGAQHGQDILAVLAGGVDIAADVKPRLGGVLAGEPAGNLLLGLQRPDAAFADVVGRVRRMRAAGVNRSIRVWSG